MFRWNMRRGELIAFESGTQKSIEIKSKRLLKKINLEFDPAVVVAGGSASGTVVEDALLLVMPKIEVVVNGLTPIFKMDAQALYWKNRFEHRIPAALTAPATGAEGTSNLVCNLTIHFGNNVGRNYSDSFLPLDLFRTTELFVTWGALNDMFTGTYDRAATVAATYGLRPVFYETTGPRPAFVRIQNYIEKEISATQTDFPVDLSYNTNKIYQNLFFKTLDAGARDSDVINYISIETDETTTHINRIPYDQLRNINEVDFQIDALPAGFAYLPLSEEGMIKSGLNVFDVKKTKMTLDVTVGAGTTMLRVYEDMMVPVEAVLG